MSFGLRRDFSPSPYPLPYCSFQHHSPSHFCPFISPEMVYYALISLVCFLLSSSFFHCSRVSPSFPPPLTPNFNAFPPLSTTTYLVHVFPSFLLFHVKRNSTQLSYLWPSPHLFLGNVCRFETLARDTLVCLKHKAKLWISTLVFIPLISNPNTPCQTGSSDWSNRTVAHPNTHIHTQGSVA